MAERIAGLVTVVLWGSAFVGIRYAADAFSPGALALARLLVATAVLTAVALGQRIRPLPARRDRRQIAVYGVLFLGVYSVTLNTAERLVDAGTAAMIVNSGPLLIAVLAGMFLREGFPPGLFAGCAVAFAGTILIGLGAAGLPSSSAGLGAALCGVAAVAYAVAVVVQKSVLARVSAFQVTWLGSVCATVVCLPFAPALWNETKTAGPLAVGCAVYLGAGPTALGFLTWTYALRRGSAGRTGSVNYLIPVVAIGLGWALLGEIPPPAAVGGGALCLAGVIVAQRWNATRWSGRPASRPR
jgi:drug/metabolite transporter (DMT)-like permease